MWYPTRTKWQPCLRRGCLRKRRVGWPLCFIDWDELPAETRRQLRLHDGSQGERQLALVRHLSLGTPLGEIRIDVPARPETQMKKGRR